MCVLLRTTGLLTRRTTTPPPPPPTQHFKRDLSISRLPRANAAALVDGYTRAIVQRQKAATMQGVLSFFFWSRGGQRRRVWPLRTTRFSSQVCFCNWRKSCLIQRKNCARNGVDDWAMAKKKWAATYQFDVGRYIFLTRVFQISFPIDPTLVSQVLSFI